MIYITGDTHGNFTRFERSYFPQQEKLGRGDYMIVCGDFGIWDETAESNRSLDWLDSLPFTTLFVDGNHENFDLLGTFPQEVWKGGKVHRVRKNILHLMRGQVFTLDGSTFFTMGGASSHDIWNGILEPDAPDFEERYWQMRRNHAAFRVNHHSWWAEELPSDEEYAEALANLEKAGWRVDCILTHCCPSSITKRLNTGYATDRLTDFLEEVLRRCDFDVWFFGHHHDNRIIDELFILQWEQISELGLET